MLWLTFYIALYFLQLGSRTGLCCYKIEAITTKVSWSSTWTRGLLRCIASAPWKLICSMCHSFPLSFVYPGLDFLWATRRVFLEKQRTLTIPVHLVHAPSFLWSPSCSFTFVTLCVLFWLFYVLCSVCLFSMSGLSWMSLDYVLLISARIFVPLITLSQKPSGLAKFYQFLKWSSLKDLQKSALGQSWQSCKSYCVWKVKNDICFYNFQYLEYYDK